MLQPNTMTSSLSDVMSRVVLPFTAMSLSLQGQRPDSFFQSYEDTLCGAFSGHLIADRIHVKENVGKVLMPSGISDRYWYGVLEGS